MSAASSNRPRLAVFDPAGLAAELRRKHIRDRRSNANAFPGPAAPDDERLWFERVDVDDVIPIGAGLVVPIQRYLHVRPPSRADSMYIERLGAYAAVRLGPIRAQV